MAADLLKKYPFCAACDHKATVVGDDGATYCADHAGLSVPESDPADTE